jgi:hypothetical protein
MPPSLIEGILAICKLGVMDQEVDPLKLVKESPLVIRGRGLFQMPVPPDRFVVAKITNSSFFRRHQIPQRPTGVIDIKRSDDKRRNSNVLMIQNMKFEFCRDPGEWDREKILGEKGREDIAKTPPVSLGAIKMEGDTLLVEGTKKGESADMIKMKMGEKEIDGVCSPVQEMIPEIADACPRIDDD